MILFIAFMGLGALYGEAVIDLPIPLPWLGSESLIQLYSQTNWLGWYLVTALTTGIVLSLIFKAVEKIRK